MTTRGIVEKKVKNKALNKDFLEYPFSVHRKIGPMKPVLSTIQAKRKNRIKWLNKAVYWIFADIARKW